MVRTHKRNKRTRIRGSRTMGTGFRKKKKGGLGNRAGKGWSGSMAQKQQDALTFAHKMGFEKYFGTRGYTSASKAKDKKDQINLKTIKENYFGEKGKKIELKEYKILGEGEGFNAEIYAKSASKSAIEKMEKAGGKIVTNAKAEKAKTDKAEAREKNVVKETAKKVEARKK